VIANGHSTPMSPDSTNRSSESTPESNEVPFRKESLSDFSLNFIAEWQANLNSLSLIISKPLYFTSENVSNQKKPLEYQVIQSQTSSSSQSLLRISRSDSSSTALLLLPTKVEADQKGIVPEFGDCYSIKLSGEQWSGSEGDAKVERANENPFIPAPLPASRLNETQPAYFRCFKCNMTIIQATQQVALKPKPPATATSASSSLVDLPQHRTRYRALPSAHWEELVDAWMCHGDQELNQSVLRGKEGIEVVGGNGNKLQKDEAWVSEAEITWEGSRARTDSLNVEKDNSVSSTFSQSCFPSPLLMGYKEGSRRSPTDVTIVSLFVSVVFNQHHG